MYKLSFVASATLLALGAGSAHAQTSEKEAKVERIEVTGSRILREGAIAPAPVTIISGEELLQTGAMNIGEVLNELPALASTYSLANSGRFIGTAGLNLLDLRNMGTSRTLVLVDGKRHVSSSAGSASVDVNTIPSAWIESVEVITGGASAVYGADAVTGVVNFKLKKNIEGLDVSLTRGWAGDNPYENEKLTLSYGTNFNDGKGNIAFSAELNGQDAFNSLDRESTRTSWAHVNNPNNDDPKNDHDGVPDKIWVANAGWYDDNPAGNFSLPGDGKFGENWYIFNQDGSVRQQNLGTQYEYGRCSDCELLDLNVYSDLQPEFKRYNLNLKANYDMTESLNIYGEAKYVNSQGDNRAQPAFFEYGRAFKIKRDNAYVDDSLAALMDSKGVDEISVHRFMTDVGRRFEENTRETTRFVAGLTGEIFNEWELDTYAIYGKTELEQINHFNIIKDRVRQSVDAVKLEDGSIVCRDEAARTAGCIPTSIFGVGAVNPQAAEWFSATTTSNSKIQQTVVGGTLSNSALFDLPAGPVGVSVGMEYRKEQSDSVPDAFAASGATTFNALQETHGKFNVKEAYAEFSVPLLADLPLIQDLSFDSAVRYAKYSTIGNATSWKLGLNWSINDELRARGTLSKALRAPSISELYGPQDQTFFNVTDPCNETEIQNATRRENCRALGVPEGFDSQADNASIEGKNGGNPELKPEDSRSYTYGLVYQPEFVPGLSLTLDYWSIDIKDAIDNVSASDILKKCVDSTTGIDNQFCSLVTRDSASSEITNILSITQNVARQTASGVDFELGYDFDALSGSFVTKLIGTYLESRKEYSFQTNPDEFEEQDGTIGESKWQANASIAYTQGAWSASWKTRFLSRADVYNRQDYERNPDPSNVLHWGGYFVTDITAGYKFDNGFAVKVGIDNLFDRDLPVQHTSGTGAGSASYDNIGRFYYTTLSYSF